MIGEKEGLVEIPKSAVNFNQIHFGLSECAGQQFGWGKFRFPQYDGQLGQTDFEHRAAEVFQRDDILPPIARISVPEFLDLTRQAQKVRRKHGAFRTSIHAPDLRPEFGEAEVQNRLKLQLFSLTDLLKHGIAADNLTVTLEHFIRDQKRMDQGGWLNKKTIDDYVQIGLQVLAYLAPFIPEGQKMHVSGFNEASVLTAGELGGLMGADRVKHQQKLVPPAVPTLIDGAKSMKNMAEALKQLKEKAKEAGLVDKFSFGICHAVMPLIGKHKTGLLAFIERPIIRLNYFLLNGKEMKVFKDVIDEIAFHFYAAKRMELRFRPLVEKRDVIKDFGPEGGGVTGRGGILLGHSDKETDGMDYGWRQRPHLIFKILQRYARAFPDKKLYISETGCPGRKVTTQLRHIIGIFRGVQDFNDWAKANGYENSQVKLIEFWTRGPTEDWGNPPAAFNFYHLDNSPRLSGRLLELLQQPGDLEPKKPLIETILWAGFGDDVKAMDTLLDQIKPGWRFNRDRLITEKQSKLLVTPIAEKLARAIEAAADDHVLLEKASQQALEAAEHDHSLWEELAVALGIDQFTPHDDKTNVLGRASQIYNGQWAGYNRETIKLLFLASIYGLSKNQSQVILNELLKDREENSPYFRVSFAKNKDFFASIPHLPKWVRDLI